MGRPSGAEEPRRRLRRRSSDRAAGASSVRSRAGEPRSVRTSVVAGLALAAVLVATFFLGPTALFVFASVIVLVAQAELYAVLKASGYAPAATFGLVAGAVLLVSTYVRGAPALTLAVTAPLPLLLVWTLTVPRGEVRAMLVSTYLGLLYGPFLIGFAILLLRGPDGLVLTATVIGMTAVHDSGSYLLGRKVGRHPMAPKVSPGKSWEGFASGTGVVVVLSVAFLHFVHPFDVWLALKLAGVISVSSPIGDLAESALKRDLGVKDMGSLLPGHGGLFDRIDALILNAPVAYFVLRILGWAG